MRRALYKAIPDEPWRLVPWISLGPVVYGEPILNWRRGFGAQWEYLGRQSRIDTAYRAESMNTTVFARSGRVQGVLRRAPVVWRGVQVWGARYSAVRTRLPTRVKVIGHESDGVEACYSDAGVTLWIERGRVVEVITSGYTEQD